MKRMKVKAVSDSKVITKCQHIISRAGIWVTGETCELKVVDTKHKMTFRYGLQN